MKKLLVLVLALVTVLSLAVLPAGAIEKADHPIPGPDAQTIWTGHDFLYTGEPTAKSAYSNAWTNEAWQGLTFSAANVDGVDCVAIVPSYNYEQWGGTNGYSTEALWDFNYYQYDNDFYYPSLVCANYPILAVKYMYNESGAAHADKEACVLCCPDSEPLGNGGGLFFKTWPRATEQFVAGEWYIDYYDMTQLNVAGGPWVSATIRQFQLYPFGNYALLDGTEICYIEWVGWFGSIEEAQAFVNPKTIPAETEPPVTEPPVTEAPATEPPVTEAPQDTTPVVVPPKTVDLGVVVAAVAAVAAGSAVIVSRRKRK
jgi:hypothetical protein